MSVQTACLSAHGAAIVTVQVTYLLKDAGKHVFSQSTKNYSMNKRAFLKATSLLGLGSLLSFGKAMGEKPTDSLTGGCVLIELAM